MARTKKEKGVMIDAYSQLLDDAKGIIVVKTTKVTPNEVNEFKKELFDVDAKFHVVKNTLFKIALEKAELGTIESLNFGSHSVLFFKEDVVNPSKALKTFIQETTANKTEKVEIVGGFLDGNSLSLSQIKDLADMPSKEESIAMILGILDQAIAGVANVLQNPVQSYATIIDQAFKEE